MFDDERVFIEKELKRNQLVNILSQKDIEEFNKRYKEAARQRHQYKKRLLDIEKNRELIDETEVEEGVNKKMYLPNPISDTLQRFDN